MRPTSLLAALALSLVPLAASAQETVCVPGNPLYDRGDYRCFAGRPRPTRARATVRTHVEAARYLSGGSLSEHHRQELEDHFDGLERILASELPSLVDGDGSLHTPDVRIAVVFLPSGQVGRVRVLSRHGASLDRQIAQRLSLGVSNHASMSIDGSEVEAIVRMRPQMFYTRYRGRPVPRPCCAEIDDGED